jgi:hypothetical protein
MPEFVEATLMMSAALAVAWVACLVSLNAD